MLNSVVKYNPMHITKEFFHFYHVNQYKKNKYKYQFIEFISLNKFNFLKTAIHILIQIQNLLK